MPAQPLLSGYIFNLARILGSSTGFLTGSARPNRLRTSGPRRRPLSGESRNIPWRPLLAEQRSPRRSASHSEVADKRSVNVAIDPLQPVVPHRSGPSDFADPPMAVINRKKVVGAAALPFETIPADLDPAQTATEPQPQLHKQETGDHAQHQIDDGARLLGRVGQHLVGRPDK